MISLSLSICPYSLLLSPSACLYMYETLAGTRYELADAFKNKILVKSTLNWSDWVVEKHFAAESLKVFGDKKQFSKLKSIGAHLIYAKLAILLSWPYRFVDVMLLGVRNQNQIVGCTCVVLNKMTLNYWALFLSSVWNWIENNKNMLLNSKLVFYLFH